MRLPSDCYWNMVTRFDCGSMVWSKLRKVNNAVVCGQEMKCFVPLNGAEVGLEILIEVHLGIEQCK